MEFQVSRYVTVVPHLPDDGSCLAFSVLTMSVVALPMKWYDRLSSGGIVEADGILAQSLVKQGILIEPSFPESGAASLALNMQKYGFGMLALSVMLTLGCNCQCCYCYESGIRQSDTSTNMDTAMAQRICRWVSDSLDTDRHRHLSICFTGGEPLLNLSAMEIILRGAKEAADACGVTTAFSSFSNGVLLTPEVARRLADLNLRSVTVTIDGPRDLHDQRRPLTTGGGTFDTIIENVRRASEYLSVHLYSVVDVQNADHMDDLVDALVANDMQKYVSSFELLAVLETGKQPDHVAQNRMSMEEFADLRARILTKLLKLGIPPAEVLPGRICPARAHSDFALTPNGSFYKCIDAAGADISAFAVGSLNDSLDDLMIKSSRITEADFISDMDLQRCRDCKYRPICAGGCFLSGYMKSGEMVGECNMPLLEKMIPLYLAARYSA